MPTFKGESQPLTVLDLHDVEIRLGIDLPPELRSFYLKVNGGKPDPRFYPHNGELYGIDRFLAMKTGDRNIGFEEAYEMLRGMPEFPRECIPFAIDDAGDYYIYSLSEESFGHILFNQSDYINDAEKFVISLCTSLEQLINLLTDA